MLHLSACYPGYLENEVTAIPLYLSRVRFAIVQGARDKTNAQWMDFTKDLDYHCRFLTYDHEYGNPGNPCRLHVKTV